MNELEVRYGSTLVFLAIGLYFGVDVKDLFVFIAGVLLPMSHVVEVSKYVSGLAK